MDFCGTVTGPGNPSPFHQTLLACIQASTLAPRQRLDKWPPRGLGRWREGRAERPVQAACLCPAEWGEGRTQPGCSDWQGAGRRRGHGPRLCGPWAQAGGEPGGSPVSSSGSPGDSHGQVPPPRPTEATEGRDGTKGPRQSPDSPSPPVVKGGQWGGWQGAPPSPWREGGVWCPDSPALGLGGGEHRRARRRRTACKTAAHTIPVTPGRTRGQARAGRPTPRLGRTALPGARPTAA